MAHRQTARDQISEPHRYLNYLAILAMVAGVVWLSRSNFDGKRSATIVTLLNLQLCERDFAAASVPMRQPSKQFVAGADVAADAAHPIDIWHDGDPRNDPNTSPP